MAHRSYNVVAVQEGGSRKRTVDAPSNLTDESMHEMLAQDINVQLGWVQLRGSVFVRRSIGIVNSERIRVSAKDGDGDRTYISFGIKKCEFDKKKGELDVDMCLIEMQEEELSESEGRFPLLLVGSEDESLQMATKEPIITGTAVIIEIQVESCAGFVPKSDLVRVQKIKLCESKLCRGSTKFFINRISPSAP